MPPGSRPWAGRLTLAAVLSSLGLSAWAEVPADELYVEGQMANEFHRTVSRIIEMQSREYLEAPRRTVASRIS